MYKESMQSATLRFAKLERLQKHYTTFETFLVDVVEDFMGFNCTEIQKDIGEFLEHGPSESMIQAQRGQAKTTITAAYAVYELIHKPWYRVLIFSAGSDLSKEISNWIIQIIMGMEQLECLRPDRSQGDRQSVTSFDIHSTLKGPEKSPSVACVGINSNTQGKRADLLIADDIESAKNSQTETMRDKLKTLTRDFTSICSNGKIVYLGTPQSIDSIYNSLPSRGYTIRIWTGRYPTLEEEKNYGNALAPIIQKRMRQDPTLRIGGGPDGSRGKPVDPVLLGEAALTKKEIDQGPAYFQLQHMLDTKLMDVDRYPLHSKRIVFMSIPEAEAPVKVHWVADPDKRLRLPQDFPVDEEYYEVTSYGQDWAEFQGTHMYIDPSGGGKNGDELAWGVTRFNHGNVYLVDVGGIPGGLHEENQQFIAKLVKKWKPHRVDIEDNFGGGMFRQVLTPVILKEHKCEIEGVYEAGQKELRIIDVLEPLIGSQRFIVEKELLTRDWKACSKYGIDRRSTYSFFFQLARITRERNCLRHDDRIDAVAGSCRYWVELLNIDKEKEIARIKTDNYRKMVSDPLGNGVSLGRKYNKSPTVFDRFRR